MKTKPRHATKAEKERVQAWCRKWKARLFMHMLEIKTAFHSEPHASDDPHDSSGVAADINCEMAHDYHVVVINFYPRFFAKQDAKSQERSIVHELAHVITNGLTRLINRQANDESVSTKEASDADERTTDWIANIAFFGAGASDRVTELKLDE